MITDSHKIDGDQQCLNGKKGPATAGPFVNAGDQ